MKRAAVIVAIAATAGSIWYLQRPSASKAAAPTPPAAATESPPAGKPAPIAKVTKLATPEQRHELANRIASAQASRAASPRGGTGATHAPPAPSLPASGDAEHLETLRVELKSAMREVIPMLTDCYEASMPDIAEPQTKLVAELTLTGDPDVGTVIDAKQLVDDQGKPLPTKFDDCLRSTFQTLALPPLAEGDEVAVHYPFTFAKN